MVDQKAFSVARVNACGQDCQDCPLAFKARKAGLVGEREEKRRVEMIERRQFRLLVS